MKKKIVNVNLNPFIAKFLENLLGVENNKLDILHLIRGRNAVLF